MSREMLHMSIVKRLKASRIIQFSQQSETSQSATLINSPTSKSLTPKDGRICKRINSPNVLTPKDRKFNQRHDSDILHSPQSSRSIHGRQCTTPKNRLTRRYSRQASRQISGASESQKPESQIQQGSVKIVPGPTVVAQEETRKTACEVMLKAVVDGSKEAENNITNPLKKMFDNMQYRVKFTTAETSFHVGLRSARGNHGSENNSTHKLERFKIRTINTGDVMKGENK